MKHAQVILFAASLETVLDERLFRAPDEERKKVTGGDMARGAAEIAGGAGAVGGAYAADRAIMGRYGSRGLLEQGGSGPMGRHNMVPAAPGGTAAVGRRAAYSGALTDAGGTVQNRVSAGLRAGRHASAVLREDGAGLIASKLGGLRKGVKVGMAPLLRKIASFR